MLFFFHSSNNCFIERVAKKVVNTNLSQQSEYRIWNCILPTFLATVKISELFWKEKSSKLLRRNLVCPRRKPQHQIYMLWQKLKECRKSNANHKNKINEHVFSSILQYYWLLFLCSLFTAYFSFIHSTSMLHKSFAACAYASFIVFLLLIVISESLRFGRFEPSFFCCLTMCESCFFQPPVFAWNSR